MDLPRFPGLFSRLFQLSNCQCRQLSHTHEVEEEMEKDECFGKAKDLGGGTRNKSLAMTAAATSLNIKIIAGRNLANDGAVAVFINDN